VPIDPQYEDPGRVALLAWLKDRMNADNDRTPDLLWHYTDAVGLKGIVKSERLRATQTGFLNDAGEMEYGVRLASETIRLVKSSDLHPTTAAFLGGLADPTRATLARWLDEHVDVYVTCFCGDGDLLSQWRAYAGRDEAGGYAIGIGTRPPLQGWVQLAPGGHELAVRRVLYDEGDQDLACHQLIDALVPVLDEDPADIERQKSFARSLVDGVVEIASWFKHPAFSEEQEWRIVYVRSRDESKLPLHHRSSRGLLVPHVDLEVPSPVGPVEGHLPVQGINLGPGPEPALKGRGVRSFLEGFPHYANVRVTGSSAPLRI
jgi:hypothetical protein